MKILTILFLFFALIPASAATGQKYQRDEVIIASDFLAMPIGRLLLISRGDFVGAVKFLHNDIRQDGIYSKYEIFEFQIGGVKKIGEGEVLYKKPSDDKGWFLHQSPTSVMGAPLKIGGFQLCAEAAGLEHARIYFWSKPHKVDQKVKMAPTPWEEVGVANPSDPRIRWFPHDEKRERKVIPIEKIWY